MRRPVLQCPINGCDNYLCSHHYDDIPSYMRRYFHPSDAPEEVSITQSSTGSTSSNGSEVAEFPPSDTQSSQYIEDRGMSRGTVRSGNERLQVGGRGVSLSSDTSCSNGSSLSRRGGVPTGHSGSRLNRDFADDASDASWQVDAMLCPAEFESVDENAVDDGGGDDMQDEGYQLDDVVEDHSISGESSDDSYEAGSIRGRNPRTEYPARGYAVTDLNYDQDRFIVDAGECAGGMHAMEYDDDSINAGRHRNDVVIPSSAIEGMRHEGLIPTTICNQGAPTIRNKGSYLPGHVILNNLGSLLVRKDKKLKGTTRQRNFLQRIASTSPGRCVPLLYPEACVFPGQFWTDAGVQSGGTIPGALPCSFLCNDTQMAAQGMASIGDHMRCRLSNTSLLSSTDPRYICYAFDSMVNLGLRGEDSRVILSRGFANKQGRDGIKGDKDSHRRFDTDTTDSRPTVHRLAAAVGQEQARYFYTHTCNQKSHFGISRVKNWIDSEEYLSLLLTAHGKEEHDEGARREFRQAGIASAAVVLLRNWMETAEIYMNYIANSPEQPLGKVRKIWWRHEYQDGVGNLSHIHALIWLDGEPETISMNRIRGSTKTLIYEDEIPALVEEGLVEDVDDINEILEHASRVLKHSCSDRCKTQVGQADGEVRCRVASSMFQNITPTRHVMKEVTVRHSKKALFILQRLGLFEMSDRTGEVEPSQDNLRATRHYPSCVYSEGVMSPVNSRLFVGHRSSDNLQIVTGYNASRYLAKYVAGIDEHNRVHIGSSSGQPNSYEFDMQFLHNTKVGHSAKHEKARLASRRDAHHANKGRAMSIMEIIALIFGYDQVYTTIKFRHISTHPMEERAAYEKRPILKRLQEEGLADNDVHSPTDLDESRTIPSHIVRERIRNLPSWRKHTPTELILLRDQIISPLSLDSVTTFGIRPPELRFIRDQSRYFRWFVRKQGKAKMTTADAVEMFEKALDGNYSNTGWIDGTNCRIYVRRAALPEIVEYMETLRDEDFGVEATDNYARTAPTRLFRDMKEYCETAPTGRRQLSWERLADRFLYEDPDEPSTPLPVIWCTNIRPTEPTRFILHLLLTLGRFDNELDLLNKGSLRQAMIYANLFDPSRPQESIDALLSTYITEQLIYIPGSSQQFDRYLIGAHEALADVLLHDRFREEGVPPVLFTSLEAKVDEDTTQKIARDRRRLAECCLAYLREHANGSFPTTDDAVSATHATPLPADRIVLNRPVHQSEASRREQEVAFEAIRTSIREYSLASPYQVKSHCLIGGPGNGKTFVMLVGVLQCICAGLSTGLTAYMSERAQELGGEHLHKLFCLPGRDPSSPARLAELALVNLYRNPTQLLYLRQLQVLCIDELGQIPSEMLAALDIILRRIRNSSTPFGGLLIISTMDPLQLHPVRGRPPLLSPHFLTSFRATFLRHSVRASRDANLRRIQTISRMLPTELTAAIITEFKSLVASHCTFVDDWDDPRITQSTLRVFGKKAATEHAERQLLRSMSATYGSTHVMKRTSIDQESTPEGMWNPASSLTSKELSREVKEPAELYFYPNAVYEITFNRDQRFSQSQLAVLLPEDLPSATDVESFAPVNVMVAPEGTKHTPEGDLTAENLRQNGWVKCQVGLCPERSHTLKRSGLQARRYQYGLRHRIASTIHAAMGQNLQSLVTKVSNSSSDSKYSLWEREQAVVLLSRTHYAKDIIFVGLRRETVDAIASVLLQRSQYSEYIAHLLTQLSHDNDQPHASSPIQIDLQNHPFRPVDVEIPYDNTGYCYLLVSLRHSNVTYIGQTNNIRRRLREHNSGYGAMQTSDERLRPWALLSFVCGFEGKRHVQREFERRWQSARFYASQRSNGNITPSAVADLAAAVIDQTNHDRLGEELDLRLVHCGRVG